MANTLNAGSKWHLHQYVARNIDGKVRFKRSKVMIGEEVFESDTTMCGLRHSSEDLRWFSKMMRKRPERVCKKCSKKLKEIIEAA